MSKPVDRVVLFKIPEEHIDAVLAQYSGLKQKARKDDHPYILRAYAQRVHPDPRSDGYTVCAHTSFASMEDMKYYDVDCEAHKALKEVVKPKATGMMMVYMDATHESRGAVS